MVTGGQPAAPAARPAGRVAGAAASRPPGLVLRVDGREPLSSGSVADVTAVCDRAEDSDEHAAVIVYVSGAPEQSWTEGLSVALVSRWERGLRRLERLPAATIAVAVGDCGGLALDALLATDYRIAAGSLRLMLPVQAGATWPGMAVYRLSNRAGAAAIRRAVLFGLPIEAADALALHLVDELTDDLASALAAATGMTDALSGAELAIRRQLMLDAPAVSFEEALGQHLAACDRALRRSSARMSS
jgi:isomerase DpgB